MGGCTGFVGGGWMRERKTERWRIEMKKEEREIFYIILLCNLYYFNMKYEKNKIWVVGYIIKWYSIINKVVFWNGKIRWNGI